MTISLPPQPGPGRPVGTTSTGGRHHPPVGTVAMQRVETGATPRVPEVPDGSEALAVTGPAAPEGAVPSQAAPSEPSRYVGPGYRCGYGYGYGAPVPAPRSPRPAGPPPARTVRNPLATAGVVVALIGFVLALIPLVDMTSWLVSPVGLGLSVVGFVVAGRRRTGAGLAIAGVVLSLLGLIVCALCVAGTVGAAAHSAPTAAPVPTIAAPGVDPVTAGTSTSVRYEVTGSGTGMVTYTDDRGGTGQETAARLPWSKDFTAGEYFTVFTLGVTSTDGGPVGCRIVKDGSVVSEQQASGPAARAACSGH